jgi:hypothetical protein
MAAAKRSIAFAIVVGDGESQLAELAGVYE